MKRVTALALLAIAAAVPAGCRGSNSPSLGTPDSQQRTSQRRTSQNRLIVLGHSIGGIRLDEPRKTSRRHSEPEVRGRGIVWYFGGRLRVDYWFHDGLTTRVEGLETRWGGFHLARRACRVKPEELRALHVACPGDGDCSRAAGRMPDAPGTVFTMRHGKVVQIDVSKLTPRDSREDRGSGDIPEHWPTGGCAR